MAPLSCLRTFIQPKLETAVTGSPGRKRGLVAEMCSEWAVSIRRECRVLLFDQKTFRFRSRRPDQAALEKRIKEICGTRVRYCYRRGHFVRQREGWYVKHKMVR